MALTDAAGDASADWIDATRRELGSHGSLLDRVLRVLPAGYDELNRPATAAIDIVHIVALAESGGDVATAITRFESAPPDEWRFRVYRRAEPLPLADLLPLLDNLGLHALDERAFVFPVEGETVHLYDVGVRLPAGGDFGGPIAAEVRRAFEAQLRGAVESDGLNRLVLNAGLGVRDVDVLRSYVRYLRQIGFPSSQQYIIETLVMYSPITRMLVELFSARFDPEATGRIDHVSVEPTLRPAIEAALDGVPSLDADRTLRALLSLVDATLRTNVYQMTVDGGTRPVMAFKLDPARVPDLPAPRPFREIWICSPTVEGVHLRGGAVARGGIRWSDRREDFRTEVLGLVKAQMVKNAVIVPTGAKGGFVVKRVTAGPEEFRTAGLECYQQFIAGLLDVTDNIVLGEVVHPPRTVRWDDNDPYLVVAADKGTAAFSDVANAIAVGRGFWLGDAFASGGSAGYDHKAMGITARGAWESVRRHARALGKDADTDPLTVVGIGDMSGDVFGNGMLRSRQIRLVAAFDHRHVFIDPDPDPDLAFAERSRLFGLPRSSWADYDATLISKGGGVFDRKAKSVELSVEARRALGTDSSVLTPNDLVNAVLRAPVDLLWNGGIGTYVKASTESHVEVGDRANDAVRVNGIDLRCRMVAEGGNLGLTQRGRVEYALAGGLINTDAIDNSAGVDCSDHEVNIKILLGEAVGSGELTMAERDELLAAMTDEVADQVLDDNRAQTLALAVARARASAMVNVHARYLRTLESEGWIDRGLEHLPSDKQIAERQAIGGGLAVPEFAVLMAYTKTTNIELVGQSSLPDDPVLRRELAEYFPSLLRARFGHLLDGHRLRREIITTRLCNQMVNMSGITFDHRITEETGIDVVEVTRAWVAARDILDAEAAWDEIESIQSHVRADVQIELLLEVRQMIERTVLWLLRHQRPPIDMAAAVHEFRDPVRRLASGLDDVLSGRMRDLTFAREAGRLAAGVPEGLAQRSSQWPVVHTFLDVVRLASRRGVTPATVARSYWRMFETVDAGWIWDAIGAMPRSDRWQTQARSALRDGLLAVLADLADDALAVGSVDAWAARNERVLARTAGIFAELRRSDALELTALTVALRQLHNLVLASPQEVG